MKFPFAAFMCIIVSGLCFSVFIVFNYAFQDTDVGMFNKLDESAQKIMDTSHYNWFAARKNNIAMGFGILGIVVLLCAILITVAAGVEHKRGES